MGFYPAVATVGNVPVPLPVVDGGTGVTWGSPITQFSGSVASDVEVATETAVLTTPNLAVGTWLIMAGLMCQQETASTANNWSCRVNGGTATYTVTGGNGSAQQRGPNNGTANLQVVTMNLSFTVNVTVAGTVVITAYGDAGTPYIKAATPQQGYANASGYTALRVA